MGKPELQKWEIFVFVLALVAQLGCGVELQAENRNSKSDSPAIPAATATLGTPTDPGQIGYLYSEITLFAGQIMLPLEIHAEGNFVGEFSVDPELPAGLSIDRITGTISGTPTTVTIMQNYDITVANVTGFIVIPLKIETVPYLDN